MSEQEFNPCGQERFGPPMDPKRSLTPSISVCGGNGLCPHCQRIAELLAIDETWTGCGTGDCPHPLAKDCAAALVEVNVALLRKTEPLEQRIAADAERIAKLEADKVRVDWLEGEWDREQEGPNSGRKRSLFRCNVPITRKAIDAALEASDE